MNVLLNGLKKVNWINVGYYAGTVGLAILGLVKVDKDNEKALEKNLDEIAEKAAIKVKESLKESA